MTMTFHIRQATTSDLDALVASVSALFVEDGGPRDEYMDTGWPIRHGHAYWHAAIDDADTLCLIAVGEHPAGHLIGRLNRPDDLRPKAVTATLESIRVAEHHRASGVGTALHDAFLAWTRERGANELKVQAYAANTTALAFYRARGYQPHIVGLRLGLA
jgi:GNAT superfamily N-acetyltransferase